MGEDGIPEPEGRDLVKVIYSIGARFAGGGIGTTAYYGASGLNRHGMLHRLFVGSYLPTEIPRWKIRSLGAVSRLMRKLATFDDSGWVWYIHSVLYDAWVSLQLSPADVLVVWGNYALRTMQRAKELGMVTVLVRASTHPRYQARLLAEEYARWGLKHRVNEALLRRAIRETELADYTLIPSDFVRRSFLEEGYPEEKLIQVAFGVDTKRFHPPEREIAPHPFRALFVGQVSVRKGVPYLLEAWRRLNWQDAELWIVGRPSADVDSLMDRYRALPGVHWKGHTDAPVSLFQQADVFVFPTVEEGSALVTYEALACGLPVVTTPNAGSVVRDGVEGLIVSVRDVDALASALEHLRADEQLWLEMGRAARVRAEEFTWEQHGKLLVKNLKHITTRITRRMIKHDEHD